MISSRTKIDKDRLYPEEDASSSEDEVQKEDEYEESKEKVSPEEKKIEFHFDDSPTTSSPGKENKENHTKKKKLNENKRRRRSSAKFLHLGRHQQNAHNNDDSIDAPKQHHDDEKLSQMYKKTLRMNAENRINVGNTWSLGLIDHLDKFLADDDDADDVLMNRMISRKKQVDERKDKRINFTKASVTLDASVKIYSYRVDDTHLSSYKVLANLNRTDNGKSQDGDAPVRSKVQKSSTRGGGGEVDTLESNIDNINVCKLEQDYDVDPLFHKMSKTFDEGGAKGLLLVNLGVSNYGCNILFDNSAYEDEKKLMQEDEKSESEHVVKHEKADGKSDEKGDESMENVEDSENVENNEEKEETEEEVLEENMKVDEENVINDVANNDEISTTPPDVDAAPFVSKLKELLHGQHIAALPLVPQLDTLREDLTSLEKEGFVADDAPPQKSKRYATDAEEEEEAERSIHQEALERSRMSACNLTYDASVLDFSGFGESYNDGGLDGGIDDDVDNEVSQVFSGLDFSLFDSNNEFSAENKQDELVDKMASKQQKCTGRMLDLICKSNLIGTETDYQFFNDALLQKMSSGNFWAGANHWKRSKRAAVVEKKGKEPEEKVKRKKSNKIRTFIDFSSPATTLESLLDDKSTKKRGKGKDFQLSATAVNNQLENDHILPLDAGIGLEEMGQLFLRKATIKAVEKKSTGKHVGFNENMNDTMFFGGGGFDDGVDDDYDAPGCESQGTNFGDFENYQSQCADEIRKVDKIEVKYATVSKKVDVKRLKRDLWSELEVSTGMKNENDTEVKEDDDIESSPNDPINDDSCSPMDDSNKEEKKDDTEPDVVSFRNTVDKIDASQSQNGVTLPFYFICLLHLANEKGLRLDSPNLQDIIITSDDGTIDAEAAAALIPTVKKTRRKKKKVQYEVESDVENDFLDDEAVQ